MRLLSYLRPCAASSLRCFVPILLLLIPCLFSPAHAAHWAVTYQCTGSNVGVTTTGQPANSTWSWNPNLGHNCLQGNSTWEQCKASGTITPVLTWTLNTGETVLPPAPQQVMVQVATTAYAYLSWSGTSVGNMVQASDSLDGSGTPVVNSQNATCQISGTHYLLLNNPTAQAMVMMQAISGSATSSSGSLSPGASDSINVNVTPLPLSLNLGGTTPDTSGNLNILVGQGCTASLSGIPSALLPYTTYSWSVMGTTFQDWAVTYVAGVSSTATLYSGIGTVTNPTAHWYWSDKKGTKTITCTANITPPIGQGIPFTVTATKDITLQTPQSLLTANTGRVQINNLDPGDYGIGYCLYAGPSNGNPHGISYTDFVKTPELFSTSDTGLWNFVQTVTPGAWGTQLGQSEQPYPPPPSTSYNGLKGLDTVYPFKPSPFSAAYPGAFPATTAPWTSFDGPSIPHLQDNYINYRVSETFRTYIMYRPPGEDTKWVPVSYIGWYWNANASIPVPTWENWDNSEDAGIVRITSITSVNTHPQWNILVH